MRTFFEIQKCIFLVSMYNLKYLFKYEQHYLRNSSSNLSLKTTLFNQFLFYLTHIQSIFVYLFACPDVCINIVFKTVCDRYINKNSGESLSADSCRDLMRVKNEIKLKSSSDIFIAILRYYPIVRVLFEMGSRYY